jgi:predicted nucleic acid-binding protein
MKAFFDTSVLVPVFYGDHVHHQASLDLFIQCDKQRAAVERTAWLRSTPR